MARYGTNQGKGRNTSFDITPFVKTIPRWVELFRTGPGAGDFSYVQRASQPDVYGCADHVITLWTLGLLDEYLMKHPREEWISTLQSFQDPETGWFLDQARRTHHFRPHTTAFAIAALVLLGGQPLYPLKFVKKLETKKKLERWLSRWWLWAPRLHWAGSHIGSGVPAAVKMTNTPVPEQWWDWYFGWLDAHVDPRTGYWKHGLLQRPGRVNMYDLGCAFHYYFLYVRAGQPLPFPQKIVDSTLTIQQTNFLWFGGVPYCPDLDAIYAMARASEQAGGYRREDIEHAIQGYLEYVVPKINDEGYLFQTYTHTHGMTGLVATLAEVQRYLPSLLHAPKKLTQVVDVALYI